MLTATRTPVGVLVGVLVGQPFQHYNGRQLLALHLLVIYKFPSHKSLKKRLTCIKWEVRSTEENELSGQTGQYNAPVLINIKY